MEIHGFIRNGLVLRTAFNGTRFRLDSELN